MGFYLHVLFQMCFAHEVTEHEEGLEKPRKICPPLPGGYIRPLSHEVFA